MDCLQACEVVEVSICVIQLDGMVPGACRDQQVAGARTDARSARAISEIARKSPHGVGNRKIGKHSLVVAQKPAVVIGSHACP
jgi:hypothetical protein